ncbi:hypothetical protein GCM10009039_19270 [Halocalculus aciditolerans]|uniref:Caspase family protein n=2 Tax=Halocalculus aciditolerans TaxID=1383812 RepID=A0A830FJ49_9EURY|nr:hypothetical protein GCM10009039_19270 [Halocalculus aciditolerans]
MGDFVFPVDTAVTASTTSISFDDGVPVIVRDADGETVTEARPTTTRSFDAGTYSVEFCAALKLYVRVDAGFDLAVEPGQTRLDFADETTVRIGARSRHEHPAGTITTTTDPADVMRAVSLLGSALKTTTPERSYPTLRGHPPLVELGDEFDAPDHLERPDTGVRVEVPADYESVFVVAPLAYYLGADVVPGDDPRLVAGDFTHSLDHRDGLAAGVEEALKQVFILDCATRTEGVYDVDLHERDELDAAVDLDFPALYDADAEARLAAYFAVPFETVAPHVPEWKQTTHVAPTPDSVELLPHVVNDLALVRPPQTRALGDADAKTDAVRDFMRSTGASTPGSATAVPRTVRPEHTPSIEQSWIGEGAPLGASKPTRDAFENALGRTPSDGDVDVAVVCNDDAMNAEGDVVNDAYELRGDVAMNVTVYERLHTDALRDLLASDVDFLHFIGHIDGEGFKCPDGLLDARTLDDDAVGVDAFLLNACRSYEQGMALLERGSIAGVVTVRDVVNRGATAIGQTLARLLNHGFPITAALDVAGEESFMSNRYVVVGDGGFSLAPTRGRTPAVYEVDEHADDTYTVGIDAYPTSDAGMGSMTVPYFDGNDQYFLNSGRVSEFTLDHGDLIEFLTLQDVPLRVDGDLTWSTEFALDAL